MKKGIIFAVFVVILLMCSVGSADTIWWNADGTEQTEPPRSFSWGDGTIIASSPAKGLIAMTWAIEEQMNSSFALMHQHIAVSGIVGAQVDTGGGKRKVYYVYYLKTEEARNGTPFFFYPYYTQVLVYLSTADVDENGSIDNDDLEYVRQACWFGQNTPYNEDVDRNGIVDRRDVDAVAFLARSNPAPDQVLKEMVQELPLAIAEITSEPALLAPGLPPEPIVLFNLSEILLTMDMDYDPILGPNGKLATTWGNMKTKE